MFVNYSRLSELYPRGLTVKIVEQPCRYVRYRYESEGRFTNIFGASSNNQNTTSFAIQVQGYIGLVDIVIYSVTSEKPYRKHPSKLQGPTCHDGYFLSCYNISEQPQTIEFPELRLQQQKQTNLETNERNKKIDFNVLRLCVKVTPKQFQTNPGRVYSSPIYNKQKNLIICQLSHTEIAVDKIKENIILLCEKVVSNDIKIRFVEKENDQIIWKSYGKFTAKDVHRQTAISFRPPQYRDINITDPVTVAIQLERISDKELSPPLEFRYLPGIKAFEKKVDQLMAEIEDLNDRFQVTPPALTCSSHDYNVNAEHDYHYRIFDDTDTHNTIIQDKSTYI